MPIISEEPLKYGEHGRGIAIATLPAILTEDAPVLVIFNAGMLHRSEPFRMNVDVARHAAEAGFLCVRFDLSGKGDTPARAGFSNRESVARDWAALKQAITARFGERRYFLMGLCSGADNAIKTAYSDQSVNGLILLDPRIPAEPGHRNREIKAKLKNPETWKRTPYILFRIITRLFREKNDAKLSVSIDDVRDLPSEQETRDSCNRILSEGGFVSAYFTDFSLSYYNTPGQLQRFLLAELHPSIFEHWWPEVDHVFSVASQRRLLIESITTTLKNQLSLSQ